MSLSRRGLLQGLFVAPAIIKVAGIMPISPGAWELIDYSLRHHPAPVACEHYHIQTWTLEHSLTGSQTQVRWLLGQQAAIERGGYFTPQALDHVARVVRQRSGDQVRIPQVFHDHAREPFMRDNLNHLSRRIRAVAWGGIVDLARTA